MFWRKKAILAKIESVYGTDPTPTGAANALLVSNVALTPMENEMEERGSDISYFGHREQIPVTTQCKLSFEAETVGSGVVDTPPAWGVLLKACAFAETVNAGVSVVYAPVSASIDSVTFYVNIDGVLHKFLGARGTVSVKMPPRKVGKLVFSFTCLYGGVPTDTALPALTLTAWKTPIAVNNANTSAFTLHTYAGKLYDLSIDVANQVDYRNLVGAEDVVISDRAPAGNIMIEETTLATKDFWTIARAGTLGALSILHGTVAGYKVQVDAPKVQLINPKKENGLAGVVVLNMGLRLAPNAGNDELTITHK